MFRVRKLSHCSGCVNVFGVHCVGFGLFHPCHPSTLWIDESLMNLCEILGFQPKGVATLSFSSRKRPAYAGMTVSSCFVLLSPSP